MVRKFCPPEQEGKCREFIRENYDIPKCIHYAVAGIQPFAAGEL